MDETIMEIKGTNGTIIIYDDRVIIRRKGLFAWATQGGTKGDTVFFYNSLTGVEYKKPGFSDGYLRLVVPGTIPNAIKTGILSNPNERLSDPNTVVFRSYPESSEKAYKLILQKINEARGATNNLSTVSTADEIRKYKSLLDEGIITEEEFQNKKNQLLNS